MECLWLSRNALIAALFMLEVLLLSSAVWAAEGIIPEFRIRPAHIRGEEFPAIYENTLFTDRPV